MPTSLHPVTLLTRIPTPSQNCRGLWRQYTYLSVTEREDALSKRQTALDNDEDGWTFHVFGGVYRDGGGLWCCVCAEVSCKLE